MSDPDRAELRLAAFGDPTGPRDPVPPATARDPLGAWLAAVALGGRGRYAAAATVLTELISGPDQTTAALACATLASHRRQLGAHAVARRWDGAGLRRLAGTASAWSGSGSAEPDPDGADGPGARSDLLLGLAADAVGLGRTAEARRLIDIVSGLGELGWRSAVRLAWVLAETELGAGRADAAVEPARHAMLLAEAGPSARHLAKSGLVLGATLAAAGDPSGAVERLRPALALATARGLLPLVWPCALVLADLLPDEADGHRRTATSTLHRVLRHTDPIGRAAALASPWVPTWLFVPAPNR